MKAVTQTTVLEAIPANGEISFMSLAYHFILDEERQYLRLEQTLEKLHSQRKIEVIKKQVSILDVAFGDISQKKGSMLRYYSFKKL